MGKSKKSAANHEKWIGFRDNIQETPIFHHISWENHGKPMVPDVSCRFSLKLTHWIQDSVGTTAPSWRTCLQQLCPRSRARSWRRRPRAVPPCFSPWPRSLPWSPASRTGSSFHSHLDLAGWWWWNFVKVRNPQDASVRCTVKERQKHLVDFWVVQDPLRTPWNHQFGLIKSNRNLVNLHQSPSRATQNVGRHLPLAFSHWGLARVRRRTLRWDLKVGLVQRNFLTSQHGTFYHRRLRILSSDSHLWCLWCLFFVLWCLMMSLWCLNHVWIMLNHVWIMFESCLNHVSVPINKATDFLMLKSKKNCKSPINPPEVPICLS